jgi:hypothetical protein
MAQRLVLITPLQLAAQPKAPPEGSGPPPAAPAVAAPFFATVTFLEGGASPPSGPSGPPEWGIDIPVDPGYGRPVFPPHISNRPPWAPARPDQGLPGGPVIDNTLPIPTPPVDPDAPPGTIWPPLEPPEGPGKPPGGGGGIMPGYILVWVPGHGYRWVKVGGKPEGPEKPSGPGGKPPETAQPKR